MQVLITGAAGMIGRKLIARLLSAGTLRAKPIERLTLIDVTAPERPPAVEIHPHAFLEVELGFT